MASAAQFEANVLQSQLPITGIWTSLPHRPPALPHLPPLITSYPQTLKLTNMAAPSCSEFVTSYHRDTDIRFALLRECVTLPRTSTAELLFELLLLKTDRSTQQSERVLAYLASAERSEDDVWLRDDIRIAWITVLYAANGYSEPAVSATYQVLGLHPNKVYAAILERDRAILGTPKKPVESVKEKAYAAKQG